MRKPTHEPRPPASRLPFPAGSGHGRKQQQRAPGDAALELALQFVYGSDFPFPVVDSLGRPIFPDNEAIARELAAMNRKLDVLPNQERATAPLAPGVNGQQAKPRQRQKKQEFIPIADRKWLKPRQVGPMLGMERSKLYTILTGEDFHPERTDGLRSFKHDGQRLILPEDVEDYNRRRGGTSGTTQAQ